MTRQEKYITEVRESTRKLYQAYQDLVDHQLEWTSLDYTNTLADGINENAGVTKVMVSAVVFDTINAITALMPSGHGTNLARLL